MRRRLADCGRDFGLKVLWLWLVTSDCAKSLVSGLLSRWAMAVAMVDALGDRGRKEMHVVTWMEFMFKKALKSFGCFHIKKVKRLKEINYF